MKTKSDLEKLAVSVGATVEEDTGYRDMRVLQLVAPDGKRWVDGHTIHLKVEWAKGSTPQALKYNEGEYRDASERVGCGLEEIPADEAELYDSDDWHH